MSEGLSGRYSIHMFDNADTQLWTLRVYNDGKKVTEKTNLPSKPDWIFDAILKAHHFGERVGIDRTLEKLESEREYHHGRSFFEKASGIICWMFGHKMSKNIPGCCSRCTTIFGIYKRLP